MPRAPSSLSIVSTSYMRSGATLAYVRTTVRMALRCLSRMGIRMMRCTCSVHSRASKCVCTTSLVAFVGERGGAIIILMASEWSGVETCVRGGLATPFKWALTFPLSPPGKTVCRN